MRNILECQTTELKTVLAATRKSLSEKPVASSHDHVQDITTSIQSIGEDPLLREDIVEQQQEMDGENNNEESLEKLFNDRLLAVMDALSLLTSKNSSSTLHKAIPMLRVGMFFPYFYVLSIYII